MPPSENATDSPKAVWTSTAHDGRVWVVHLSRPKVRNAVDGPTARALFDAFLAMERDPVALVGVLHGEGGNFCAGADLGATASGDVRRMNPVSKPPTRGVTDVDVGPVRWLSTRMCE